MNSYWVENVSKQERKKLDNDYTADVCIIGAGICGLSTGYYLAKNGLKIIILDKNGIGEKASGHTTAKITLQHGLIYDYLINTYGINYALKYFEANKQAISNIKEIIDSEKIDCDFENQSNYVYTTDKKEVEKIENEVSAINALQMYSSGEKYAQFVTCSELPFKIAGGIKTKNQAQFHPLKYMQGLANSIGKNGGIIFTNSLADNVEKGDNCYITYSGEWKVKSKYVVIATHYPFINFPGLYFSKMYQSTSYAIVIETSKTLFDGMYINTKEPIYSFRTLKDGNRRLLIISGGNHKTGYAPESNLNYGYRNLEEEAKKLYPDCKILYKWNTRDCITLDKIPYIGEFSHIMPNMYVATGFNKWGMTSSNVAANIIKDKILGIENKYSEVFDSTRVKPIKNRTELKNIVKQVAKSFVSNRLKVPKEDLSSIKNDNGGIIKVNGLNIGIYKNEEGKVYAVNPTCTHLGCLLTWNNLDKTWDCPCHGSRFDNTGKNLYDPAFKDLEKYELDDFGDGGKNHD
ncbi:MAG: FAD-dependent oxidoreductase [Clostridia bacterium]|nr:FAD-dependent oxidoreductase [Clostridia bacterium]